MPLKRKQLLATIACMVLAVVVIHIVSALTLDRKIQYKEISFSSPKIPQALDGYVIAFITDTHALPKANLEAAAGRINDRKIDLLLLGGDFPSKPGAPMRSMEVLGQISAKDGIFGVDGNHDNHIVLFDAMRTYGITPLDNDGLHIQPGFYLAGVADLWQRKPDIAAAVADASPADFVVLLSHNPDLAMLQDTAKVDLMLSGHTHGGQITLFGLWAPRLWPFSGISQYGQKFMSGWCKTENDTMVFVSRGTGPIENVPRIFARPQIIFLTLRPAANEP